jgi:CopG antitoxin of type II toxin-antitoxin system
MKKKVPRLKTDRQAEAFLVRDLSGLDFSQFKPVGFEFEKKDEHINMRVPKPLLAAVKAQRAPVVFPTRDSFGKRWNAPSLRSSPGPCPQGHSRLKTPTL